MRSNPNSLPEELTLFHDVHRAHHNAVLAALARRGMQDVGQPKLLLLLCHLPEAGVTQRELSDAMHISPSTLTASLKSLEANGYVTKHSDAVDGRCKRVCITAKGRAAVTQCSAAFEAVDTRLYAGFTPEEIERLKNDYRRMLDNLYDIGGSQCNDDPFEPPLRKG